MNEKEINQEQETQMAKIDDLPVSQSAQDEVKGGPKSTPGQVITYTYMVTNTGP